MKIQRFFCNNECRWVVVLTTTAARIMPYTFEKYIYGAREAIHTLWPRDDRYNVVCFTHAFNAEWNKRDGDRVLCIRLFEFGRFVMFVHSFSVSFLLLLILVILFVVDRSAIVCVAVSQCTILLTISPFLYNLIHCYCGGCCCYCSCWFCYFSKCWLGNGVMYFCDTILLHISNAVQNFLIETFYWTRD